MAGRIREAGLGRARGTNSVSLADARAAAAPLYRLVKNCVDPLEQRKVEADAARAATQAEQARALTCKTVAGYYIDAHEAGWRNTKHAVQWRASLAAYVSRNGRPAGGQGGHSGGPGSRRADLAGEAGDRQPSARAD
jgi:hypothetical protein